MARIKLPPIERSESVKKSPDSRLRANKKWDEKHSRITLKVVPELKKDVEKFAKSRGMSVTAFLVELIKKEIY